MLFDHLKNKCVVILIFLHDMKVLNFVFPPLQ